MAAVWFALMAASAGVFLHAGIKFPWFVFFQKDSGLRPPDPPLNMRVAMIAISVLCIALGSFGVSAFQRIPDWLLVANQWLLAALVLALYPLLQRLNDGRGLRRHDHGQRGRQQ